MRSTHDCRRSKPTAGLTLLEVVVSVSVLIVVLSSLSFLFTSMTDVSAEVTGTLDAEMQCARALEVLFEDLQATDSLGTDDVGQRHCEVRSSAEGTDDILVYRKIEGFASDAGSDTVEPVFGGWYTVSVDDNGNLVRSHDAGVDIIAARTSAVRFSITTRGLVTIDLTTQAGREDALVEATRALYVLPENLN